MPTKGAFDGNNAAGKDQGDGGAVDPVFQGSSRIRASKAADHALGAGAANPITNRSARCGLRMAIQIKTLHAEPSPRALTR